MKIGIIIYSNDIETIWNAFRFGNFVMSMGDKVNIFLLGKGVELESLNSEKFNIQEQINICEDLGGQIYACGTCLDIHCIKPSKVYKVSTMKDMYDIVQGSDKVVSF